VKKVLTIGIPTYNRADVLELNIKSLIMQLEEYRNIIEIVISDNGSIDNTEQTVKKYIKDNSDWIKYKKNEKNIGINNNMYRIIHEYARGEFLWIIGDDDMLINGGISELLSSISIYRNEVDGLYINHGFTSIVNRNYAIRNNYSKYDFNSEELACSLIETVKLDNWKSILCTMSQPIGIFFGLNNMVVKTQVWKQNTEWDDSEKITFDEFKFLYPHMNTFMKHFINKPLIYIGKPLFLFAAHERNDGINSKRLHKWMNEYKLYWNSIGLEDKFQELLEKSSDSMILEVFMNECIKSEVYHDSEFMEKIICLINNDRKVYKHALNQIILDDDIEVINILIEKIKFIDIKELKEFIEIVKKMYKNRKERVVHEFYKNVSSEVIYKFVEGAEEIVLWGSSELSYCLYNIIKDKFNDVNIKVVDGYYRNVGKRFYDTNIIVEDSDVVAQLSKIIIASVQNYKVIKNIIQNEYKDKECIVL
jgi:glycosyltransferase involved in cell wall biosynthesis